MAASYQVFISAEAYTTLQAAKKTRVIQAMDWIRSLQSAPHNRADYTEKDFLGRSIEIKVVEAFAIYYWVDHAAREVKIVRLRSAD